MFKMFFDDLRHYFVGEYLTGITWNECHAAIITRLFIVALKSTSFEFMMRKKHFQSENFRQAGIIIEYSVNCYADLD